MLGLLTTILGGWVVGGWVVGLGFCKIKANSAQLELELGLSLATRTTTTFFGCDSIELNLVVYNFIYELIHLLVFVIHTI